MILRLAMLFAALIGAANAQEPKMPRIGFLAASSAASIAPRAEAFRQGLRQLGYVEGKNIALEYRWADGNNARLPGLAAELVRLKVDIIVSAGPAATRSAKAATSSIPIVMAFDPDPVGSKFVASLARPGGNVTGLSAVAPDIAAKQLELLKQIMPKLARVAVVDDPTVPGYRQAVIELDRAAGLLAVRLSHYNVREAKDFDATFAALAKDRADAALVLPSSFTTSNRAGALSAAAKHRIPTMYFTPEFVDQGGLINYSTNLTELSRRAAAYVDKILRGAKPATLPVEQATKFELAINLKTAEQIGLTIPPDVVARADKLVR
jgi:putative ABC transport system substrate-binding protein